MEPSTAGARLAAVPAEPGTAPALEPVAIGTAEPAATDEGRWRIDGRYFADARGRRVWLRGVTYGTFRPRADGTEFPPPRRTRSGCACWWAPAASASRPRCATAARPRSRRGCRARSRPRWGTRRCWAT